MKPAVAITEPTDGSKINRETVTVKGTIEDANLEYVKVNGQAASVKDGQFSKRIILENGSRMKLK